MANKNILTTAAKTLMVEQVYFSPVAVVPPSNTSTETIYAFLSKIESWNNDEDIPAPTSDQKYIKQVFKNMFVAKRVKSSDISPVIYRVDWQPNQIYDYYRDDVDMSAVDDNGNLLYTYYVKNRYDQVFKCLWNNNDNSSSVEPYFEPGSYNTNNIFQSGDGYKWKYIYTIDLGLKVKFMDDTWIPIPVGANTPNPLQTTAGAGSIDVINVTDTGSGYDPANALVSIVITGDGTGASASANVVNGQVVDVIVTSPGSNYTYANVSVSSALGSNATLIAPVSPVGGHGFDPISELGSRHVMITSEFSNSEGGVLPTDIDFHQIGLLVNPTTMSNFPDPANAEIYRTTTDVVVAPGFGSYTPDEYVFQGNSLEEATFIGRVLSFNTSTNVLYLINTTGTISTNSPIFGDTSKTTRTLLTYTSSNFAPYSGYMIMIENRSAVQRSSDGIEQFRFVLGY
jgi:hypothetical protein